MDELRQRVRLRQSQPGPEPRSLPDSSASAPTAPSGLSLYDLSELRRNIEANNALWNAVGVVNPRPPGLRNNLIQLVKKLMSRLLSWYTRPLHQFHGSVTRSLNEVGGALEHLCLNLEQALESQNRRISSLEGAQQILFAGVKERLEGAAQRLEAFRKEALFLLDSDKGPKAKHGLRFNDPIMTSYDEKGQPFWWGTHERIVEKGWVFRHLSDLPVNSRILDVGCAESILSIELASSGFRVTGMDVQFHPLGHPNFIFIQGDICRSQLDPASFDAVIALSTIEHIGLGYYGEATGDSGDRTAVEEICRLLKKGGRFLITVPYGKRAVTPLHRIYDERSLQSLLRGFKLKKAEYAIKVDDKTWFSPVPQEEAAEREYDSRNYFPSAVAMIHCVKP